MVDRFSPDGGIFSNKKRCLLHTARSGEVINMGLGKVKEKKRQDGFPRHHRENRFNMYRLLSYAGIFLICCLLLVIGAQHLRQRKAEQELLEYKARIEKLEQRQEAAENEIERLHDLDYIEIQARNRLGLVKPDETIFQIED